MKESVLKQIAELEGLSLGELRKCWRERCDSEPPAYGRAALKRRLAYRIQELAYRGVSEATRAHLRRHLEQADPEMASGKTTHAARQQRKNATPLVGTSLLRDWQGARYEVTVLNGGFEYEGRRFRSLSAIAREITGTRWNGPAFFGLRKPQKEARC